MQAEIEVMQPQVTAGPRPPETGREKKVSSIETSKKAGEIRKHPPIETSKKAP